MCIAKQVDKTMRIADFYLCTTGRTGFGGGVTGGGGRHRGQTLEFPKNTYFKHLLNTPVQCIDISNQQNGNLTTKISSIACSTS